MKLHRRLIGMVGLGMLLIIAITASAINELTTVFLRTTHEVDALSQQLSRVWEVENKISVMHLSLHGFVERGDAQQLKTFNEARAAVLDAFQKMPQTSLGQRETKVFGSLMSDFTEMEKKSERAIALARGNAEDRKMASNLLSDLDSLLLWMGNDVGKYKEENTELIRNIMARLHQDKVLIVLLIVLIFTVSLGFLFGFGAYLYRRVSVPLNDLWVGTEAISRGDLDYRIPAQQGSEIARLADRFNEMARKLKESYSEIEQKLLDRIRNLVVLDSMALALEKSGTLEDLLHTALRLVVEKLADLEPKGGIFLCEPDNERLRLAAHLGLSREFIEREGFIRMGECLCGQAAQSGELLYTNGECRDERHTRMTEAGAPHSHVIVPLKSRGVVLGVMFLYPSRAFLLNSSDVQLLDSIGAQLGMAIENFRFYSEVKETSEKYWDLFEHSYDILCILDAEGRFSVVNKAAEEFFGTAKVGLAGKSFLDFLSARDAIQVRKAFGEDAPGPGRRIELEVRKGDGGRVVVEMSMRRVVRNREVTGFQVALRDVTEQRRFRQMLLETERLAAICQLGIAVRHEINNPLTTLVGNAELLLDRISEGDTETKKRLEVILNNALRIAEIVKQLEGIKKDKVVEYLEGVKMTDLKQG